MNKTALRKILAEEGLLPQKRVASKALARMLTDFYKQFAREVDPILIELEERPVDVRLSVLSDMQEIMGDIGFLEEDGEPSTDGYSASVDCEIRVERADFDLDIEVHSNLDVSLLHWEDERAKKKLRDEWEKRWNTFFDKFLMSEDFVNAAIKQGVRERYRDWSSVKDSLASEIAEYREEEGMNPEPAWPKNMRFRVEGVKRTLQGGDLVIKLKYVGEIIDEDWRG